jgi:Protein of unknown function (DUF1367)
MGRRRIDITGQTFGRLTVLRSTGQDRRGEFWWDCRCACGKYTEARGSQLRAQRIRSCGCLARDVHRKIAKTLHLQREPIVADVMLVKRLNGLHPADDAAAEVVRGLGQGEIVRATVRKPRNVQFHRKFFALLQLVHESTDAWPTVDALLIDLKFRLGHVEPVQLSSGEIVRLPKSISFARMDDVEFHQFFNRAIRELCEMAGGIAEDDLRQAVLQELAA